MLIVIFSYFFPTYLIVFQHKANSTQILALLKNVLFSHVKLQWTHSLFWKIFEIILIFFQQMLPFLEK